MYRTAALRVLVTTMALALPSSICATVLQKCSTMICAFLEILEGCSFTKFMSAFEAWAWAYLGSSGMDLISL